MSVDHNPFGQPFGVPFGGGAEEDEAPAGVGGGGLGSFALATVALASAPVGEAVEPPEPTTLLSNYFYLHLLASAA